MYIVSIALVLTLFSTVTQVFTAPVPRSSLISRSEDDSLLPRDEPSLVERHLSYEPLVARSHGDAEFEERSLNFFDPNDFDERSLDIEEPEELEKRSVFERRSLEGSAESRQMHKRGWFKNTFKKIKHRVKHAAHKIKHVAHKVGRVWNRVQGIVNVASKAAAVAR